MQNQNENTMLATKEDIAGVSLVEQFKNPNGQFYCSIKDDGSRKSKVAIFNAINGADESVADHIGEVLEIVNVVAHPVELPDEETGEIIECLRTVLVDKNGKIKEVELARSSGNSLLDKEAIRVVKKMPRWTPGTIYNKPEGMAVTMPVEFRLDTIDKVVECPIVGVWQQCVVKQNAAGKLDVNVGSAIKVYDNDNTYYSLFPYRNNISGFVAQRGCYDIVDDNTFREKILSHFNKPWEGTVSVMNYEFIDEEKMIMKIVYTNTSNNFTDTEFWLRIKPLE